MCVLCLKSAMFIEESLQFEFSCYCSELGAMLAVDLGRAVALLEQHGLAHCVGLALEMRSTLCSSEQLCRC